MFNPIAKLKERFALMRPWRRRTLIAAVVAFYFLFVYNTGITAFDDFLYKVQCCVPFRDILRNRGVDDGIGHELPYASGRFFDTKYVCRLNGQTVARIDFKDDASPIMEMTVSLNNCTGGRLSHFDPVFAAYFDKRDSRYLYSWLRYEPGVAAIGKQASVLAFAEDGGPRNADCTLHDMNTEDVALDSDDGIFEIHIGDVVITPGKPNPITPRRRARAVK